MSLIRWIDFATRGDERGYLVALEANKNIPFDIKRVYYLTGMKKDVPRGFHAHKELHQVAICLSGKCILKMDDGKTKSEVWLDSMAKGLIIPPMVWHEMHEFSENCVLMVLASEYYDESDYIRDYQEFQNRVI